VRQTGSGINFAMLLWKNAFNVKYLGSGERYGDVDNGNRIGNHPQAIKAINWHRDL